MNVNMFSSMLFGKDPAEAYIESEEGKAKIHTHSRLTAVMQILINKKIITENELNEYIKKIEELFKDEIRKQFKEMQEE